MNGLGAFLALAVLIGLWIAFIYFTGQVAGDRGHSTGVWYFAAFVLGPIALVAALAAPYTPEMMAAALARSLAASPQRRQAPAPVAAAVPVVAAGPAGGQVAGLPSGQAAGAEQLGRVISLGQWRVTETAVPSLQANSVVEVRVQTGRVAFVSTAFTHRWSKGQLAAAAAPDGSLVLSEESRTLVRLAPFNGQSAEPAAATINEGSL